MLRFAQHDTAGCVGEHSLSASLSLSLRICDMKLVTFKTTDRATHAGVVFDGRVIALAYPTLLELLSDQDGIAKAPAALASTEAAFPLNEVALCAPIPDSPSVRDFYAFEQHVKTARAQRGLGMIP